MNNVSIFCLTLKPEHEKQIKKLSYIPVGLGHKIFPRIVITINLVIIFLLKIHFMVNILFTIGFGKIILEKLKHHGLDFVSIENFS